MGFEAWWELVITRLRSGGLHPLPAPKPVDRDAFEAGMESDEWAWVYYHADQDDGSGNGDGATST